MHKDIYAHTHPHAVQYNLYLVSIYLVPGSILVADEMTHIKRMLSIAIHRT